MLGQQVKVTDANNYVTTYTYDQYDRLGRVTQDLGNGHAPYTEYAYDLNGNRILVATPTDTTVADAPIQQTEYSYDGLNRFWRHDVATDRNTDGQYVFQTVAEWRYDDAGNQIKKIEQRKLRGIGDFTSVAHYEYDAAHRLTRTSYERQFPGTRPANADEYLASTVRYAYDGAGRRVYMWDGYGPTWYTYDAMGALQEERSPWQVVSYTYDALMRPETMISSLGITSYQYDAGGRLTQIAVDQKKAADSAFHFAATYRYDAYGKLSSLVLPLDGGKKLKQQEEYFQLPGSGGQTDRLKSRTYTVLDDGDTETVWNGTYTYDLVGMIKTFDDAMGPEPKRGHTYEYDQAYRLKTAAGASGNEDHPDAYYAYDEAGNRTTIGNAISSGTIYDYRGTENWQVTQTTNLADQVTLVEEKLGTSKKVSKAFSYEPNGNNWLETWTRKGTGTAECDSTTTDRTITNFFDDAGRLVKRTDLDNTLVSKRQQEYAYVYDGDGRRLSTEYQEFSGCGLKAAEPRFTWFEYAGGEVLSERTSSDAPVWYVRDPGGNLLFALHWRKTELKPDAYVKDILGSVRMVIGYNGKAANKYRYDAYGVLIVAESGQTLRNSYTFTGYQSDASG